MENCKRKSVSDDDMDIKRQKMIYVWDENAKERFELEDPQVDTKYPLSYPGFSIKQQRKENQDMRRENICRYVLDVHDSVLRNWDNYEWTKGKPSRKEMFEKDYDNLGGPSGETLHNCKNGSYTAREILKGNGITIKSCIEHARKRLVFPE